MALHGRENRDDMVWWDRRVLFVERPPCAKGRIWAYIKALFRWWDLGKNIGYIRTIYHETFNGSNSIEEVGAHVARAVGVGVIQNVHLSTTCGPITCTSSIFAPVNLLFGICPDKVEDGITLGDSHRSTKHVLEFVLVEL